MSNPIKVAALGFWHVHPADYAARVQQHPDTELVAIWDDDPARGKAAAYSNETTFVDDLEELLARDDIDAVTVTAATSDHHSIMLRAAQAGKHIVTEKLWRRLPPRPKRSLTSQTRPELLWLYRCHGCTTDTPGRSWICSMRGGLAS